MDFATQYQNKYVDMPMANATPRQNIVNEVDGLIERLSKLTCVLRMTADSVDGAQAAVEREQTRPSPDSLSAKVAALSSLLCEAENHAQRTAHAIGATLR